MRSSSIVLGAAAAATTLSNALPHHHEQQQKRAAVAEAGIPMPEEFAQIQATYMKNMITELRNNSDCTRAETRVRRSWDDISDADRIAYINAVKCLANKPATVSPELAPGAVNRLDDFTYIHINQTNRVHQSGSFLPWHRLFMWQMENALRDECGYEGGTIPYWDSPRFSDDQTRSRIFDGNPETSLGGDGEFLPGKEGHGPFNMALPGLVVNITTTFPAGTGGGCVTSGPFSEESGFKLSLGPVDKPVVDPNNKYGLQPNPRCLRRNFDAEGSGRELNWDNAMELLSSPDISVFRPTLDAVFHRKSHAFLGRDGVDLFTSPNDPAFYLLHSQMDRLWALWQGQDYEGRKLALYGNRTFEGIPLDTAPTEPPASVELEDVLSLADGEEFTIREGMGMAEDGRCYLYV